MRSLLRVLLATYALVALPLSGQSNLDLELHSGFRGAYRAPGWVPFRLRVENLGPSIAGTLRVEAPLAWSVNGDGGGFTRVYQLDIARGARKEFSFTLPISEGFSPLQVFIEQQGEQIEQRSLDLPRPLLSGRLIVVLSRQPSLDFLIGRSSGSRLVPVYPLPEQLPERWSGYSSVDTVVLHNAELSRLSRSQAAAIGNWVRSGGLLIVLAGAEFSRSSAEAISGWFPFRYLGSSAGDGSQILTTRFHPIGGSTTLFESGSVRAFESEIGRGTVRLLNADPRDLSSVDIDTDLLWSRLFTAEAPDRDRIRLPIDAGRQPLEQPLLSGFLEDTRYAFPPRWIILLSAALYVAALWLLLRHSPRFAALLAVLATVGVITLRGPLAPPAYAALQIEQYFGRSSSSVGYLDSDVLVLGTAESSYEVSLPPESSAVPLQHRHTTLYSDETIAGNLTPWRITNHLGRRLQESPLRIRRHGGGTLSLFNRSRVNMDAGAVITNDSAYATGSVNANAEETLQLQNGKSLDDRSALTELGLLPYQQNALSRIVDLQGSQYPGAPLFVGWMAGQLAPIALRPAPVNVGRMSIVIVALPQEWFAEEARE